LLARKAMTSGSSQVVSLGAAASGGQGATPPSARRKLPHRDPRFRLVGKCLYLDLHLIWSREVKPNHPPVPYLGNETFQAMK
jgi:hypothetical protein